MAYEAEGRQIAAELRAQYGRLLEAHLTTPIRLVFERGSWQPPPNFIFKFGYVGSGPDCFHAFLQASGFDIAKSVLENAEAGEVLTAPQPAAAAADVLVVDEGGMRRSSPEALDQREDARRSHEQAVGLMDQGRLREALDLFNKVLRATADDPEPVTYLNIAVCHAQLGEFSKALGILTAALRRWPDNARLKSNYDAIKADMPPPPPPPAAPAEVLPTTSKTATGDFAVSAVAKAVALIDLGQWAEAAGALQGALGTQPESPLLKANFHALRHGLMGVPLPAGETLTLDPLVHPKIARRIAGFEGPIEGLADLLNEKGAFRAWRLGPGDRIPPSLKALLPPPEPGQTPIAFARAQRPWKSKPVLMVSDNSIAWCDESGPKRVAMADAREHGVRLSKGRGLTLDARIGRQTLRLSPMDRSPILLLNFVQQALGQKSTYLTSEQAAKMLKVQSSANAVTEIVTMIVGYGLLLAFVGGVVGAFVWNPRMLAPIGLGVVTYLYARERALGLIIGPLMFIVLTWMMLPWIRAGF